MSKETMPPWMKEKIKKEKKEEEKPRSARIESLERRCSELVKAHNELVTLVNELENIIYNYALTAEILIDKGIITKEELYEWAETISKRTEEKAGKENSSENDGVHERERMELQDDDGEPIPEGTT